MSVLELLVRWTHLAASLLLVGGSTLLLLAGSRRASRLRLLPGGDGSTARRWEQRVVRAARVLLGLALASGIGVVATQAALLEGRAAALLEPGAWLRLILATEQGHVWAARVALLTLGAAFAVMRADVAAETDWLAARSEIALLAGAALAVGGIAGHAAAVEPGRAVAIGTDILHLLAAGVWIGGLPALALLLAGAAREEGADARPLAVLTARRFSRVAFLAAGVLAATGGARSVTEVGSVAALVGTTYGRLLLVKLVLVGVAVALAARNRRLLPALSGEAVTVGRPAMRRLATGVAGEAALLLGIVGVVVALAVTPPAAHESPVWPFPVRVAPALLDGAPALRARVLVGSQVAILGVVAASCAVALAARRVPLLLGGVTLAATGLVLALPPLAVRAYPTTYARPTVAYHATSIARGLVLYRRHCAACHGPDGDGDGPERGALSAPPPSLRGPRAARHTAGDLFWWIGHGMVSAGMPALADRLGEEERWDLVNALRALGDAAAARALGPTVGADRPRVAAPDFTFAVGPMPPISLRELRGRVVLLVLYRLPASRPRLARLAGAAPALGALGAEVVAAPWDADPDAIRRLGGDPPFLFPVATDGASDLVTAYGLLGQGSHVEFLIDRQGYLRAVTGVPAGAAPGVEPLLADVRRLDAERAAAPPLDLHVH